MDFTALKTAIQNAVKLNGNEEITGDILQGVLLSMVNTLGDSAINDLVSALANEVTNRQNADGTLQTNITNEATARGNADTALGTRIDNEVTARENADTALSNRITAITDAIDNGYVYAGIATTSTEPATGKVFYLTTATGVFTNFGGITDNTKGIKILKMVGSTWTSDTVIVMDDTPTENSTNLVKSGGVYASIASVLSKIAEGYLYVGIATAATNPSTPTTKVFYIAVAAGTYTNFLDSSSQPLVLTQGINILKFNGTSWSAEQVWGIDDVPTPNSNKLVKSGGVFNDIMTNGSAFDLSAYNNGATYADLNAALTALNALPAAYKKGGMSMKFVQSSDNKYVQYRFLRSGSFTVAQFTSVNNWQKCFTNSDIFDKNTEETRKNGYELIGNGNYAINARYNSSGDMYVSEDLQYETDTDSDIFCYNANGYIGRVASGQPLREGTTHVRINWRKTQNTPYFYSHSNALQIPIDNHAKRLEVAEKTINSQGSDILNIQGIIRPNQNTEENFHVGYEVGGTGINSGIYVANENYISSGDIYVDKDLQYNTNYTGTIFCRNANGGIGKVSAGQPLLEGTTYVRINWRKTQSTPYFYGGTSVRWPEQEKRLNNIEPRLSIAESSLTTAEKRLESTIKEVFENQNIEENFHIDYEIIGDGSYHANSSYISSGDIKVNNNLLYITDYSDSIFCYNNSGYIGRITSGQPLIAGTTYIRINWLKTQNAPYLYNVDDTGIQSLIDFDYKINGDDMLGYELQSNGNVSVSPNWRTSQFIKLEDDKNYICNRTAKYYYYDGNLTYLGRIETNARTVFNNSSYTGAMYMRTEASINSPIEIYEVDSNGNPIVQRGIFKGVAENILNETDTINANKKIEQNINIDLPNISSSVEVRFKTNQSIYKQSETIELFRIGNIALIKLVPVELTEDSIYCDKSKANISVKFGTPQYTIPLRLNNYGKDLFSLRIKYPIVNVASNGLTEMVTPMPSAYEGMYIEKTDTQFVIHNGDDSVFKSWTLSNYTDIDAFVEALKIDTDVTDVFEIKKYGCEGMTFSEINNFEKILLCKEHTEILYTQGENGPIYTGNVYWDSYPTIIRSSDIGYEHVLKVDYRVLNSIITKARVSLDGMTIGFSDIHLGTTDLKLTANINGIISQVLNVSVLPYKLPIRPMISMQHSIHVNENLENTNMVTTTMRQYEMLAYLKKAGFVGQNFEECMASISGAIAVDKPTYCLTFDDYQANIWRNREIRDLFNQFRAKPTLVYLFVASDLDGNTPPSYALTADEYRAAKASGWSIIAHGFCMYTNMLSYSQFYQGFTKNKEAWLRWYGEDVQSYNPHGRDIVDYQFYLMKHMGFNSITSGTAELGCYCECGTLIDVQYRRVIWMDSEYNWSDVKNNIDVWNSY